VIAHQGDVTRAACRLLQAARWTVVYSCVPNTPHVGVIPIPTPSGSARQRYPDILATDGTVVRLVEVEPRLTRGVATNIIQRLGEQVGALSVAEAWESWRRHVEESHGLSMPREFVPRTDLVVCAGLSPSHQPQLERLAAAAIAVSELTTFQCGPSPDADRSAGDR